MDLKTIREECEKLVDPLFACQKCGGCCGLPLMTFQEASRIRRYLIANRIEVIIPETMEKLKEYLKTSNRDVITCQFLSESRKCLIYPERPIICRICPFIEKLSCSFGYAGERKAPRWLEVYRKHKNLKFYDMWVQSLNIEQSLG